MMTESMSLSTVALEMGLSVLIGILAGNKLDEWFLTPPVFFWIGLLVGVVAAGRALWRAFRKVKKQLEEDDGQPISKS